MRSEWEAEQMQVINWVWQGGQAPRQMLRSLAGWLDGCMVSLVGEGGTLEEGGVQRQRACRTQLYPTVKSDAFLKSCCSLGSQADVPV